MKCAPGRFFFFSFSSPSHIFTSLIHFNKFIITLLCLAALIAPIPGLFTKRRCCCRKDKQIKEFSILLCQWENCISLCTWSRAGSGTAVNLCSASRIMGTRKQKITPHSLKFQGTLRCSGCREHIREITGCVYLLHFIRHDEGATV